MPKFKMIKSKSKALAVKFKGRSVSQLVFESEKPRTLEEVRDFVAEWSKAYADKGITGYLSVACLFPFGWKSGQLFEVGDDPEIYQGYDNQDVDINATTKKIVLYALAFKKPRAAGGDSEFNDCLFNCIRTAYGNSDKAMPTAINKPWKFKEFLGLQRNDKVPIECIPKVEEALNKVSITIYGDYSYVSTKEAPMNINIKLTNEHFQLMNNENRAKTKRALFKPVAKDKIIVYKAAPEWKLIINGSERETTPKEIREYQTFYDHIVIRATKKDLKETHDNFIDMADRLLDITDKKVNLYRYPTIAVACLDVWRFMSKLIQEPEPIEAIESEILDSAFMGGLTYAQNGYSGFGVCYDINSMYPTLMCDPRLQFSMAAGKAKLISEAEAKELRYYKYGIYRARVDPSGDISRDKLFRFSKRNRYTHFDLTCAQELGLTITILQDKEWNFYEYDKTNLVQSSKMFSEYIRYFYEIKKSYKPAKLLLNTLWGALCEKHTNFLFLDGDRDFEIRSDVHIQGITPSHDLQRITVDFTPREKLFKSDYARIGPFLTSYGRLRMVRQVKDYASHIVRIHTDSVLLDEEHPVAFRESQEMGHWKREYACNVSIQKGIVIKS